MNISCPNCALTFPLIAGVNDADARKFAAVMGELPSPVTRPLIEYLQLFKPPKSGLRWKKMLSVTCDIAGEIIAGEIRYDRRTLPAGVEQWAAGMQDMAERRDKLSLPLTSNGYLRKIVFGLADKAQGEAEREREERVRSGRRTENTTPAPDRSAINNEIRSLQRLLEHAPNAARPSLEKQIAELKTRLGEVD
ncbi:MAG: hypothetical protein WD750_05930 [Gammaproteobacteria bacterium]